MISYKKHGLLKTLARVKNQTEIKALLSLLIQNVILDSGRKASKIA